MAQSKTAPKLFTSWLLHTRNQPLLSEHRKQKICTLLPDIQVMKENWLCSGQEVGDTQPWFLLDGVRYSQRRKERGCFPPWVTLGLGVFLASGRYITCLQLFFCFEKRIKVASTAGLRLGGAQCTSFFWAGPENQKGRSTRICLDSFSRSWLSTCCMQALVTVTALGARGGVS